MHRRLPHRSADTLGSDRIFWEGAQLAGKRVLVTGADGFIGSHLTEALVVLGAEVTAFCYYNSFDSRVAGWTRRPVKSGNRYLSIWAIYGIRLVFGRR